MELRMSKGMILRAVGLGRHTWPWILIATLALVLRLLVVALTPEFAPQSDAADYDRLARSLAAGDGYLPTDYAAPGTPSALRAPAYPLFLALSYVAFGADYTVARIIGGALGVATVLLIGRLGEVVWGRRVGLVAAALAAVFPPLVLLNASLFSEALFLPLVLGAVLAAYACTRSHHPLAFAALAGALSGAACLTRQVAVVVAICVVGYLWASISANGSLSRARLLPVATALAACLVVITPWVLRNAAVFGEFLPISTQDGPTLAGTYNQAAATGDRYFALWRPSWWLPEYRSLIHGRLDEADVNDVMRARALEFAADHPTYVASVIGLNALRLFDLDPANNNTRHFSYTEMGIPPALWRWTSLSVWVISGLALVGLVASRRSMPSPRMSPTLLWLVPLGLFASVVAISGLPRFRVPVDPFLVLWAALGLAAARRSWPTAARVESFERRKRPRAAGTAGGMAPGR